VRRVAEEKEPGEGINGSVVVAALQLNFWGAAFCCHRCESLKFNVVKLVYVQVADVFSPCSVFKLTIDKK
jgi:hypothetical protein